MSLEDTARARTLLALAGQDDSQRLAVRCTLVTNAITTDIAHEIKTFRHRDQKLVGEARIASMPP